MNDSTVPIGIIGAGNIGAAFALALARRNIPAILSNRRGPESLQGLVQSLGLASVPGPAKKLPPSRSCWSP